MNPEQSVLDAIDELVDESLAKPWHEISGYDNDIHQPDCPHELCSREWHGLPEGRCPGSAVYGPVKPPMKWACKVGEPQVSILDGDGNVTHIGHIRPDTRDDPATTPPRSEPMGDLHDAVQGFTQAARGLFQTIEVSFRAVGETARRFADALNLPTEAEQTPQQRALPRPSHQPPMWAARADGRRRRR